MVATLESLYYACTGCQGTLEDKTAFVFDLFDFNNGAIIISNPLHYFKPCDLLMMCGRAGGDISYDEMVILMSSVLCAMIKFNNNALNVETKLPDDAQMEALTDKAFLDADANMNGTIHKAEFKDWVLNTLAKDDLAVTVSDILLEFELVEKSASFEEEQPGSDGDQCGAGGIVSSREPWLTTSMGGMGEIAVEYNLDKGMFTFPASGLSCAASDDGFVQTKYLRKLAKMKAKKLKILSVKQSRNKKRAPTQELVISPRWADQDDLSDYLQLVCLSLTEKEKALRARKELLESRIADME
jgi:hypothetical protein